jgi:hypothetical protein
MVPKNPTTLADRPIADRRGDDALDRAAHTVAHPADLDLADIDDLDEDADEDGDDEFLD